MPDPLFAQPAGAGREPLTVTQIVSRLKATVETDFGDVVVRGELSNFSRARSGHCYFSIKDGNAQIECVMWRRMASRVGFTPEDGMLVEIEGNVSIYEKRGKLQLYADRMTLAGEGALQKAFEKLKKRLRREGLFDAEQKRPLPPFPERIGLVTSGESAALQDLLTGLRRRFPCVRVQLRPVRVQGNGAGDEIAAAIEAFSDMPAPPDLLIVGRGGGSAEDLWAFNEEPVARAIHACRVPVVSAVGHETDTSIADLAADERAATPSTGAEVATPDRRDLAERVRAASATLGGVATKRIRESRRAVHRLTQSRGFHRPADRLRELRQRLEDLATRLGRAAPRLLDQKRQQIALLKSRLYALDPEGPLRRGYAFVEKQNQLVRSAEALKHGDAVTLTFEDGEREVRVEGGTSSRKPSEPGTAPANER
jgi:exodeoxyribonuclease VII large subunit